MDDVTRTNTGKVLYPATGFSKGEVLDYWERIAPVLLPHVRGRPASFKRFPDGVDAEGFFQKNAPRGTPDWVRTVELPSPGSTKGRQTVRYVVVEDARTLMWAANLAALEIHVPQWRVGPRGGVHDPDLMVFDLDPGAPATVVECCRVALMIREELARDGLDAWPKVSGSKGLHVHVPLKPVKGTRATAYARGLAERLVEREPELVVAEMDRSLRGGKVFVDWNQNNPARTTVAPYSLRACSEPTVAAPVSWEEVEGCRAPEDLRFLPEDVLARLEKAGDLLEPNPKGDCRTPLPD
ncbi:non-homologous end-joining DNA ligase [Streptomyces sp. NPDC059373]